MTFKESKDKICNCGECFYCYINQDRFHTNNLENLKLPLLAINVAEYVGPEVTAPPEEGHKKNVVSIPIKLCTSVYHE